MEEIDKFIDNIECISKVRKEIYKKIMAYRYEIIKNAYEKLNI